MLKKCLDCVKNIKLDKVAVFAGGVLFGTAGLKVLGSKDAKKVYTGYCCSAACKGLRDENNKCCTGKRRGYFG